jgi:hypothetical protein
MVGYNFLFDVWCLKEPAIPAGYGFGLQRNSFKAMRQKKGIG